jgi:hypothetical protein
MSYFSSYKQLYFDLDQVSLGTESIGTNALGSWLDLAVFRNGMFSVDSWQYRSAKGTSGSLLPLTPSGTGGTASLSLRIVDPNGNLVTNLLSTQAFTGTAATLLLTEFDTSRFVQPGSKIQVKVDGTTFGSGSNIFIRTLFKSLDTNPVINIVLGTAVD